METNFFILIVGETLLILLISIMLFQSLHKISKLKKNEDELFELQTLQRDFIPMLVHELRAPLSVIQGASDLLLKEAGVLSAEQIRDLLGQVRNSSSNLLKMVGDILDVSKMDSGKFEINKVYGNINQLLDEECSYFKPLATIQKKNILPRLDNSIENISFDPERIKQVMNNLLSNALKFTGSESTITITSQKLDNFIQIGVSDDGVGVPDEEKVLLFKKFGQAKSANHTEMRGTGLGLYIAKGIVNSHKGKIWIEDNKPKGVRFMFTLPLV